MAVLFVAVSALVALPARKAYADVTAADCTSVQYFVPATPGAGIPARCNNKLDYPRDANDCKAAPNYTYVKPAAGAQYGSCKLTAAGTSTTCSDKTTADSQGTCQAADDEIKCGTGKFDWMMCLVLQVGINSAQSLDDFIMKTLDIDVGPIFDHTTEAGKPSNGYYVAWNSFRILAIAILIITGLIMVASEALGFEFLDAYTIRKTLPRLLVAVILIAVSWPLMRFIISLFDTLGFDLRGLMYGPFKNIHSTITVGGGILTTIAVGAGIMSLGFVSVTFLVTIAMALLVGFATLVIREVVIVLLVILAPVAIACSVLPNTQKAWNFWRQNFFGLMLMFPIISALIAAGHIFAVVALSTDSNGAGSITTRANALTAHLTGHNFLLNTVADAVSNFGGLMAQVMAVIAYFLPYFLLPMAARLATGIIGNLSGMINDRSRGVFDRMKKVRQNALQERLKLAQQQQLYDESGKIFGKVGKFSNSAASWLTDPLNNAAYYGRNSIPGLTKRGRKVESHIEHLRVAQSQKLAQETSAVFNDKAYRAINGRLHTGLSIETQNELKRVGMFKKTPKSLADFNKIAAALSKSSIQDERLAGNAIHGMSGRMATLYQDPEMGKASIQATGILGLAQTGKLNQNDIQALNGLKNEGGAAYAQTIGTQAQLAVSRARPDLKAGYGIDYDKKTGEFKNGLEVNGGLRALQMFDTLNPGDISGAKREFFDAKDKGGAAWIMQEILTRGKDKRAVGESAANVKRWRAEGMTDSQIVATQPTGASDLKNVLAEKQYNSVLKVLLQNTGPYARGSIEIQTGSDQILRNSFSADEYNRLMAANVPPEAVAAEADAAAAAGGPPGGGPFPPPLFPGGGGGGH